MQRPKSRHKSRVAGLTAYTLPSPGPARVAPLTALPSSIHSILLVTAVTLRRWIQLKEMMEVMRPSMTLAKGQLRGKSRERRMVRVPRAPR